MTLAPQRHPLRLDGCIEALVARLDDVPVAEIDPADKALLEELIDPETGRAACGVDSCPTAHYLKIGRVTMSTGFVASRAAQPCHSSYKPPGGEA